MYFWPTTVSSNKLHEFPLLIRLNSKPVCISNMNHVRHVITAARSKRFSLWRMLRDLRSRRRRSCEFWDCSHRASCKYISLKAPNLMHLISLSLISPTRFGALLRHHQGQRIFLLQYRTRRGFSLHFVYSNFTHCIYVFHRFTAGLATLTVCSYAVKADCHKITYKNIHIQLAWC